LVHPFSDAIRAGSEHASRQTHKIIRELPLNRPFSRFLKGQQTRSDQCF
jgi:hypothetical protein